jgi:hypothetical protein
MDPTDWIHLVLDTGQYRKVGTFSNYATSSFPRTDIRCISVSVFVNKGSPFTKAQRHVSAKLKLHTFYNIGRGWKNQLLAPNTLTLKKQPSKLTA